jgi:hypothetical protein
MGNHSYLRAGARKGETTMKCQVCNHADAEWSWQPFGPDESPLSFTLPGNHYRGFPVVKVCGFCKREVIENCAETGTPVWFTHKDTEYVFDGTQAPYTPHLWDGGTSGEPGGPDFTMLCRYTPTGHDIVAHVFDKVLAQAIIDAYNKAQQKELSSEEVNVLRNKATQELNLYRREQTARISA